MCGYLFLLSLALCVFSFTSGSAQILHNLEYGQRCNRTSRCLSKDPKDPLQRNQNNICECFEGLFRHDSLNRCVSPPNGPCTIRSKDGYPALTCTDFAMCWSMAPINPDLPRQDGACYCEPDSKIDPHTGLCKLTFGSNRCSKLTDCDVMSLITCRYGNCGCQEEHYQTYNRETKQCEALVGGTCGKANPPFPAPVCHEPEMACVKNKCVCKPGYAQSFDKKCMKITKTTHICSGAGPRPWSPIMYKSHRIRSAYSGGGGGGAAMNDAEADPEAMQMNDNAESESHSDAEMEDSDADNDSQNDYDNAESTR